MINELLVRLSRKRAEDVIRISWAQGGVSKRCLRLIQILSKEGFIKNWGLQRTIGGQAVLTIGLQEALIIKRISKSSRRRYVRTAALRKSSEQVYILSTTAGLLTMREARALHLGGELICSVTKALGCLRLFKKNTKNTAEFVQREDLMKKNERFKGPVIIPIPKEVQVHLREVSGGEPAALYFFLRTLTAGVKVDLPRATQIIKEPLDSGGISLVLRLEDGTRAARQARGTLQKAIERAVRRLVAGEKVIKSKLLLRGIGYRVINSGVTEDQKQNWKIRMGYSHEIILPLSPAVGLQSVMVKDVKEVFGGKKVAKKGKDIGSKKKIGESQQLLLEGASWGRVAPVAQKIKKLRPPGRYTEKGVFGWTKEKI